MSTQNIPGIRPPVYVDRLFAARGKLGQVTPTMNNSDNHKLPLSKRVVIGTSWLIFTRLILRMLGLVSTVVLARLLIPNDFGIVALAMAFQTLLMGVSELGFKEALIKFQTDEKSDFDTVWTLNLCRALILSTATLACSRFVPGWLDTPELGSVLLIMAVMPLLTGFSNPKFVTLDRELDFSKSFVLETTAQFLTVVVTITLAILWRNYWAMICGLLTGALVHVTLTYVLLPYRPHFSFSSTRKLFGFSIWLSGQNVINSISYNMDKFIAAGLLNTQTVGNFYMGQEISSLLTRELFMPISRALYPGFAKTSGNRSALRQNVIESMGVFAGIGLPLGFGFAFIADEFVAIVLGEKWETIVPMVQLLAPILGVQTLAGVATGAMLALGETRSMFFRALANISIRLPLLVMGGMWWGFTGLFVAHAASSFIYFILNYTMIVRRLTIGITEPLISAWRSLVSVTAMALALAAISLLVPAPELETFGYLCGMITLKITLGAFTYVSCHLVLWRLSSRPIGIESHILDFLPARVRQLPLF